MSPIDDSNELRVELSETFVRWRDRLRDPRARAAIGARLLALEGGHWGAAMPVGEDVSELRIHVGPGYRLYLARRGRSWVILLCGGDKDSQRHDVEQAKAMARELRDGD